MALGGKRLGNRPGYVTNLPRHYKKFCGKSDWFTTTNQPDRDGSETIPEIVDVGQQLNVPRLLWISGWMSLFKS